MEIVASILESEVSLLVAEFLEKLNHFCKTGSQK